MNDSASSTIVPSPSSPESHRLGFVTTVLLFALALIVLLPGIHVSLFDRDEGWYAQVCREMVHTGDWLVPRYLGEVWIAKPPLTYWLVAASYKLLGIGEWQARLVSVLATSANVVLIAMLGARMFGRRVGWFAGVMFITASLPAIVGKMLLTDPVMLLCTLGAVVAHWRISEGGVEEGESGGRGEGQKNRGTRGQGDKRTDGWVFAVYWFFIGLGILAKGPATLVFAGAFAFALLMIPGRRSWLWSWRFWAGMPVALLVAAPWYVYIAQHAGGTLFKQFVGYEIAERIRGTPHGHGGPPGYYVLLSLAGLLPWTPLVPGTLLIAFFNARKDATLRLLLIWLGLPWIILELIHSKLPHYILPCYVPLFLIVARTFTESLRTRRVWADLRRGEQRILLFGTRLLCAIGFCLVLAGVAFWLGIVEKGKAPSHFGAALTAVGVILVIGFAWSARILRRRSIASAGIAAIGTMIAFHVGLGLLLFPSLESTRLSRHLANEVNALSSPGEPVYVCGYEEPSTFFYLREGARSIDASSVMDMLNRSSPCVLAITQHELETLGLEQIKQIQANALPDPIRGFNYVKMSSETIWLVPST